MIITLLEKGDEEGEGDTKNRFRSSKNKKSKEKKMNKLGSREKS